MMRPGPSGNPGAGDKLVDSSCEGYSIGQTLCLNECDVLGEKYGEEVSRIQVGM